MRNLLKGTRFQSWQIISYLYKIYTAFLIRNCERTSEDTVLINFKNIEFEIESKDITMLPTLISGEYEFLELAAVSKNIKPGDIFLDIGSNIGIYSLLVSGLVGSSGRVIAIEPHPKTVAILRRNVQRNIEIGHIVEVLQLAISNFNGISYLQSTTFLGTSHLISNPGRDNLPQPGLDPVKVCTLDRLVLELEMNPTFIKCDVEGFEAHVIEGALNYLNKAKPKILLEICGDQSRRENVSWEKAIKILGENYFTIEVFGPTACSQRESMPVAEVIQLTLNDGRLHNVLLV